MGKLILMVIVENQWWYIKQSARDVECSTLEILIKINHNFSEIKGIEKNVSETSDTFAKHFISHFHSSENKMAKNSNDGFREIKIISILWCGDPMSCHKLI